MADQNGKELTVKWLGISGVELSHGAETVLIDPVYSRMPLPHVLIGRLEPDADTVRRHMPACSHIFITHTHYDHLIDSPLISRLTGAVLHGSENTCAVAEACGARRDRLHTLKPGDIIHTAGFTVTALRASHIRLPGFGYGRLDKHLKPPLRAQQYRMDLSFVFLVEAGGLRLLIGPGLCLDDPGHVDVLLCDPIYLGNEFTQYLDGLSPRVFLPIHWEDMFRPAGKSLKPGIVPGFPPMKIDMAQVACRTKELGIGYYEMERHVEYRVSDLMK